ncbi:organelle RRM domain-containing protein 1, chloroplastic isoform X1 [Lycium ferocissimum]|uniref:organelle RRM domain-containing protein 1, chloroplastic isoform X1 n=1 Tax=Lycium ferocissimum TaxID=112874 RepID=UPI00281600A5|nr:organelle RRM domain-containing protein 1, chloroplastic isoform X1 [Lycium ferocissimum]
MEVTLPHSSSSLSIIPTLSAKPLKPHLKFTLNFPNKSFKNSSSKFSCTCLISRNRVTSITASSTTVTPTCTTTQRHWMVIMEKLPNGVSSKTEVIDYYVEILERVLGSKEDAQMCIYNASCNVPYGFCCDIDDVVADAIAGMPGVLSVLPDPDFNSMVKDYSYPNGQLSSLSTLYTEGSSLFPAGTSKHWLVRMARPSVGVIRKGPVVDYYVQVLTKVLGNEKDAQMCLYHVSWQSNYGFCCELDEACAQELAEVPGVLSVQPDENFDSDNKDYGGGNLKLSEDSQESAASDVRTKKLFVTGLSFYTSEKTLRAAFEGYGELVEVKIIMDKISKRSKGYAFVEYTTLEAASAALKEMNGKIINGWMITVDVAKTNPPKYSRGRPGVAR